MRVADHGVIVEMSIRLPEHADVIVIGAGPSGSTLARRKLDKSSWQRLFPFSQSPTKHTKSSCNSYRPK